MVFNKINEHLSEAIDVEDELGQDEDFNLIELMKIRGRNYIKENYNDIVPNDVQLMAVILHPKMKKSRRMNALERNDTYERIACFIREQQQNTTHQETIPSSNTLENSFDVFIDDDEEEDDVRSELNYPPELLRYLSDKVLENFDSINLREWWFKNRNRFPSLYKLFLKISCIPASSAPSERAFSTTGAIITDRRSSLLPKSVSEIMICRNLYRS